MGIKKTTGKHLRPLGCIALLVIALFCVFGSRPAILPVDAKPVKTVAAGMAVLETKSGRWLYESNADIKLPMASTTKILTAIVVLERAKLGDIVKVDARAVGVEGSSVYLELGEELSVEDLLYCLILQSGNDAAEALAYHVSGSKENFAELMNQTAKKIGAANSNFVTPHGLHHENHYTTARDLARIAAYGLKNPDFKRIVSAKSRRIVRGEGVFPVLIENKNKLLDAFPGATGVKTGYTKAAGRCLVASSERGPLELVSVVLNCGPMFQECEELMTCAYEEFVMTEILPSHTHIGQLEGMDAKHRLNVYSKEEFCYPLKQDERVAVSCRVEFPAVFKGRIKKGTEVGRVKIYLGTQHLFTTAIFTLDEQKEPGFSDRLRLVLDDWLRRGK